jgi:hypothetical protein
MATFDQEWANIFNPHPTELRHDAYVQENASSAIWRPDCFNHGNDFT